MCVRKPIFSPRYDPRVSKNTLHLKTPPARLLGPQSVGVSFLLRVGRGSGQGPPLMGHLNAPVNRGQPGSISGVGVFIGSVWVGVDSMQGQSVWVQRAGWTPDAWASVRTWEPLRGPAGGGVQRQPVFGPLTQVSVLSLLGGS